MKLVVSEDMSSLSRDASKWVEEKKPRSMFLPAGRTPTALYRLWEKERPHFLNGMVMHQIDDVLTGPTRGQFKKFFEDELPSYLSQFKWIDSANETADVSLLGLGLNGHIAFHEPGFPPGFFSGCVHLSEVTCKTIGAAPGTWGITYGAGAFNRSRSVAIMVSGEGKRGVLEALLQGDRTLPASALLDHPDLTIFADRAAHP